MPLIPGWTLAMWNFLNLILPSYSLNSNIAANSSSCAQCCEKGAADALLGGVNCSPPSSSVESCVCAFESFDRITLRSPSPTFLSPRPFLDTSDSAGQRYID